MQVRERGAPFRHYRRVRRGKVLPAAQTGEFSAPRAAVRSKDISPLATAISVSHPQTAPAIAGERRATTLLPKNAGRYVHGASHRRRDEPSNSRQQQATVGSTFKYLNHGYRLLNILTRSIYMVHMCARARLYAFCAVESRRAILNATFMCTPRDSALYRSRASVVALRPVRREYLK